MSTTGVHLYVGGYSATIQGERARLEGKRCFSAAHRLRDWEPLLQTEALVDSGAFTDPPDKRLTPALALDRQLKWEELVRARCDAPRFVPQALVSYDRLIDETWIAGKWHKRRWSLKAAELAVEETVEAARFLAARRGELAPRHLVLSCQGVDAIQYSQCATEILSFAEPSDWFGFGGWCILGRNRTYLPEWWRTLYRVLPLVKARGLSHIHVFGVLWPVPLGGLLWLADQLGLTVSCDSAAPMLVCARFAKDPKRANIRCPYFRDNIAWWQNHLADLREFPVYQEPPDLGLLRQMELFDL